MDRVKEEAIRKAFGEALEGLRAEAMRNTRKRDLLRQRITLLGAGSATSSLMYEKLELPDRIALAVSHKFNEVERSLPNDFTLYGRKVFAGIVAEVLAPEWGEHVSYFSVITISSGILSKKCNTARFICKANSNAISDTLCSDNAYI